MYLGTEFVEEPDVLLARLDEDVLLDEYGFARCVHGYLNIMGSTQITWKLRGIEER